MSELWVIFALIFLAASLAIYGVYWIFVFNRREHKTINRRLDLAKSLAIQRWFCKPCCGSEASVTRQIPFCVSSATGSPRPGSRSNASPCFWCSWRFA